MVNCRREAPAVLCDHLQSPRPYEEANISRSHHFESGGPTLFAGIVWTQKMIDG
jgi:hypothetical protein